VVIGFKALTVVTMKSITFWDLAPCSLVKCCRGSKKRTLNGITKKKKNLNAVGLNEEENCKWKKIIQELRGIIS
jgi:hypothetical protein